MKEKVLLSCIDNARVKAEKLENRARIAKINDNFLHPCIFQHFCFTDCNYEGNDPIESQESIITKI